MFWFFVVKKIKCLEEHHDSKVAIGVSVIEQDCHAIEE